MKYLIDKKAILRKKIRMPDNATIILFRNPKEFTSFVLERINPNHKILVWGKLKKKYRHGSHYIRMGKILIPSFFLMFLNLSYLINLLPIILYSFILVQVYLVITDMDGLIKCLLELKAVLGQEKQLCSLDI